MSVDLLALQSMIDERIRTSPVSINVRQLQGLSGARGVATATITNGQDTAVTVPHGMHRTPVWAVATAWTLPGVRDDFFASVDSVDDTSVTINVRASNAAATPVANPTAVKVSWEVA